MSDWLSDDINNSEFILANTYNVCRYDRILLVKCIKRWCNSIGIQAHSNHFTGSFKIFDCSFSSIVFNLKT
jgi:hypothetical protein